MTLYEAGTFSAIPRKMPDGKVIWWTDTGFHFSTSLVIISEQKWPATWSVAEPLGCTGPRRTESLMGNIRRPPRPVSRTFGLTRGDRKESCMSVQERDRIDPVGSR